MGGGLKYPIREEKDNDKGDKHLRGIVDMGSNGIRFSISNLAPPTSRILPTLVSYRLDVSLYSAQYDPKTGERVPIPDDIIEQVVAALLRFKVICSDLNVPKKHIRIIATEATRTAVNSVQYRKEIKNATGIEVEMLAREEEGFVGALGVASGFSDVSGLVMDLGGGSCQITWMTSTKGNVKISPKGSFSFPYGAAALTKKLENLRDGKSPEEADKAVADFRAEMKTNFTNAYNQLEIPDEMVQKAIKEGGFPLYLSGGGFRGWGYLLLYMSQVHGRDYPISLINGFSAPKSKFEDVERLKKVARQADEIFRVSDRRRAQVPAVAFLVNVLTEALPHGIQMAHFCQGGVREGILFKELSPEVREDDPLEVATKAYAHKSADALSDLIMASIPKAGKRAFPASISKHEAWWTRYIGEIGQLICTVYPAGIVDEKAPRLKIDSEWASGFGKENDKEGLRLILSIKKVKNDPQMVKEALEEMVGDVDKVGKRKNWIGGSEGWGMAIDINIKEVKDF